jgi:prepilin-type processing-associated H-X9-DG protein
MYDQVKAGGTPTISGSYCLNSNPYYRTPVNNRSKGKLGYSGCAGAYWNPDKNWYGSVNITSLIHCNLRSLDKPDSGAHQDKGLNCTYYDGHVKWLPTPASTLVVWNGTSNAWTYGSACTQDGNGLWAWSSYMDTQ